MSIHIIVDGYNLIRQSSQLSALEEQDMQLGREALIDMLVAYKKVKHHSITIVFDGTNASSCSQRKDRIKGITVRFSQHGELADTVIKRMAYREREKALIVSSDNDIVDYVTAHGATSISSLAFEQKLIMAAFMDLKGVDEQENEGWIPTTKKKGPSKRLSRKARKNSAKMKKL